MKLLIKLLVASSIVVVMTAMSASTALARTVIAGGGISREGETVTGTSAGRITFSDSSGLSLQCNVTLRGTIKRETSGQLRVLEPATNALVGRITGGATSACSDREARVTLLFGAGLWQKYKIEKEQGTERSRFIVLHSQVLILRPVPFLGNYACLIDLLATMEYNESTGVLRIVETRTLSRTPLTRPLNGFCTSGETFRGSFNLAPIPTLTLRDV